MQPIASNAKIPHALVIENGDLVRLGSANAAIVDIRFPVGRLTSDGKSLLPLDGSALKDRRRVMFNGQRCRNLSPSNAQGRFAAAPAITVIGLVEPGGRAGSGAFLRTAIERALDDLPPAARRRRRCGR